MTIRCTNTRLLSSRLILPTVKGLMGSSRALEELVKLLPSEAHLLVRSDPRDVVAIVKLARATYGKMVQNLIWATAYNAFAIPLAAGVLFPMGILLSPALGAVLMSLSTIIVAINARLLSIKR